MEIKYQQFKLVLIQYLSISYQHACTAFTMDNLVAHYFFERR
jgi:hypothetical protein